MSQVSHSQGAQAWIKQCYLQLHQCMSLPRKHSPDGASPDYSCGHLIAESNCSLLLIYLPQKDERLSRPGWLTYIRRFTHMVTRQLQVERRTGKVRWSKTNVLPLCQATNSQINRKFLLMCTVTSNNFSPSYHAWIQPDTDQ